MKATRRNFWATAATAREAAAAGDLAAQAQDSEHSHAHAHQAVPSDMALRVKSLESLLVEKGLVDRAALDALIDTYEHKVGPRNGAQVVARAWADPAYKQRLLSDADKAIAELGYGGQQGEHMVVVENTPAVHNMVVCTLCSCYPWPVLGLPPVWYKSAPYRSQGSSSCTCHARCDGRCGESPSTPGRRRHMNGVPDMGGMHGMGPIQEEHNEPVFHQTWESRLFALRRATGAWGKWNIDTTIE